MIHFDRLLKLADYIEQIPPRYVGEKKSFDFSVIRVPTHDCGSVGCAIGYTPEALPDLVELDSLGYPVTKVEGNSTVFGIAREIFGLNKVEARALFVERSQRELTDVHLDTLWASATGKMVAKNIRAFVKAKKEQS